jgi:hypothetical protein
MAPRTKSRRISKRSGRRPRREYFSPVSEKRGYQFILLDARASTSIRLESLEKLAELERKTAGGYLSVRFLSRIIRDSTTPGKLRLAAVALLELCKAANQAKSFVRRRQKSQIQPTPMGADHHGQTCTDSVQKEQ